MVKTRGKTGALKHKCISRNLATKKATVYVKVSTDRKVVCHTQCVLTEYKLVNEM